MKTFEFSHPSINQVRHCLASEIRQDWACSGWFGLDKTFEPLISFLFCFFAYLIRATSLQIYVYIKLLGIQDWSLGKRDLGQIFGNYLYVITKTIRAYEEAHKEHKERRFND